MENEKVEIEYIETKSVPTFGHMAIRPIYIMRHTKYNRVNCYRVTCEIGGIQEHDLVLRVYDVEWIGDKESEGMEGTNDETLTSDGAKYLFEDNIE